MAFLPHHPAQGFGDLLPGFFVVPQNPLWNNKSRSRAPMGFAGARYIPHIGDLLPSRFSVPQNPLISALRSGMSLSGCCCNGGDGSKGANAEDTGAGYLNGQPLLVKGAGEALSGVNWVTVAIAVGAAYMLVKR